MTAHANPEKRHEFVLLFEAVNSNPNGDPDAGNLPRVDPETMHGLVTDVCLKRKVRDYVQTTRRDGGEKALPGFGIFIQSEKALNTLIEEAGAAKGVQKSKRPNRDVRAEMCSRYYDIRLFGAVLSTGELNAGQVRGPVQLTFARSIDRIHGLDCSITRKARTTEERMETGETEMGRKAIIPYGLYRAHGYFNPFLARDTGVSQHDLELLWEALEHLFDFDRSAVRPEMTVRGLYIFSHESPLGNAPAHVLFERIQVSRRDGVEAPRSFSDYVVEVDQQGLPAGVTLTRLVG